MPLPGAGLELYPFAAVVCSGTDAEVRSPVFYKSCLRSRARGGEKLGAI